MKKIRVPLNKTNFRIRQEMRDWVRKNASAAVFVPKDTTKREICGPCFTFIFYDDADAFKFCIMFGLNAQ